MKKIKNPVEKLEELRKELPKLTSAEIKKMIKSQKKTGTDRGKGT